MILFQLDCFVFNLYQISKKTTKETNSLIPSKCLKEVASHKNSRESGTKDCESLESPIPVLKGFQEKDPWYHCGIVRAMPVSLLLTVARLYSLSLSGIIKQLLIDGNASPSHILVSSEHFDEVYMYTTLIWGFYQFSVGQISREAAPLMAFSVSVFRRGNPLSRLSGNFCRLLLSRDCNYNKVLQLTLP